LATRFTPISFSWRPSVLSLASLRAIAVSA
jgi:hypothetical protein